MGSRESCVVSREVDANVSSWRRAWEGAKRSGPSTVAREAPQIIGRHPLHPSGSSTAGLDPLRHGGNLSARSVGERRHQPRRETRWSGDRDDDPNLSRCGWGRVAGVHARAQGTGATQPPRSAAWVRSELRRSRAQAAGPPTAAARRVRRAATSLGLAGDTRGVAGLRLRARAPAPHPDPARLGDGDGGRARSALSSRNAAMNGRRWLLALSA